MYLIVIFLPLMSAVVAGILGRQIGSQGVTKATVTLIGLTWATAIMIYNEVVIHKGETYIKLWTWVLGDIGLQYDGLTAIMLVIVTSISWLVHIYSTEYMREDPHLPRFMSYLSLFTWFMLILVTADNLMQLFIGWEGVGLCSYLLINYWYTRQQANKAAMKAMIVNRIGDVGVVIAIVICYAQYKSVEYSVIFTMARPEEVKIIGYMLLVGAVGKSAQIGLHTWLPDAMEGIRWRQWALQKLCYMREHPEQILWSTLLAEEEQGLGKIQRSGQSAGNREGGTGSSETTCKAFKGEGSTRELEWIIGFTEGDGSFIVNKDGRLEFKITQSSTDTDVLIEIKNILGFGEVREQSKESNTHHYRVRDREGLRKIIEIFNGKIQLKKRQEQFKKFVEGYNKNYGTGIQEKENIDLIKTQRAWIAGFAEAEGTFTVSVIEREGGRVQVQVRYIISQQGEKEVLERIARLFKGRVSEVNSPEGVEKDGSTRPEYQGHNMTVNLTNLGGVIEYIKENPLKTKKRLAYAKWKKVYDWVIAKEHINNPTRVEEIRELVKPRKGGGKVNQK